MPRSPSGASARPSPRVSIKSPELNALHTSRIQDMVHLNGNRSNLPSNCGTSFWQHKATGLTSAPTASDARDLGINISKLRRRLERDAENRNRWIEIDRVGYRYNRMVAFTSGMFHSATRHFGSDLKSGRIFQTFRIGINWSSFHLTK